MLTVTYPPLCFLDVRKAFDTVWIDSLFYKLKNELGIEPKIWLVIKELFSNLKGQVIFNGNIRSSFSTSQGSGKGEFMLHFCKRFILINC